MIKIQINSQSLEDTQFWYISQKYTYDNYTLEKYALAQKSLVMVATSLVMVATSLVIMATPEAFPSFDSGSSMQLLK